MPVISSTNRREALDADGPIVNRARRALSEVAQQFGTITATTHTSVSVDCGRDLHLEFTMDPGNYVFSRVYGLRIGLNLPTASPVPPGLTLAHGSHTMGFRSTRGSAAAESVNRLNRELADRLAGIDIVSARTVASASGTRFELVPMGGSFVWVLVPPIFKATAFPAGEPARIIDLFSAVRLLGDE